MHEAAKMVKRDELMRLLLCGHMLRECATEMRLSYWTVRAWAKEPEFLISLREKSTEIYKRLDAELASSKEGMRERLEEASEQALAQLIDLAAESTGMLKLKALQDILDRDTRVSRTHRVEGDMKHDFISPLFLGHAARVARELDNAGDGPTPERALNEHDDKI